MMWTATIKKSRKMPVAVQMVDRNRHFIKRIPNDKTAAKAPDPHPIGAGNCPLLATNCYTGPYTKTIGEKRR